MNLNDSARSVGIGEASSQQVQASFALAQALRQPWIGEVDINQNIGLGLSSAAAFSMSS